MSAVGRFNEKQRELPVLEKQITAIGLYANRLGNDRLRVVYARELAELEKSRNEARGMAASIHEALQGLVRIRQTIIDHVPGAESFLGQWVEALVPIAIVGGVVYAVNRIDSWIKHHDGSVTRVREALQAIDKMPGLAPDQRQRLRDYTIEHGGLPNPDSLKDALTGAGIGVGAVLAVGAAILLPRLLKSRA